MSALDRIRQHFYTIPRPTHLINGDHCCECAEHAAELAPFDHSNLPYTVISSPAWDPICFCTPEGFRYLFPRLCELASVHGDNCYLDQFLFHLENRRQLFSPEERKLIQELLLEWTDRLNSEIDRFNLKEDMDRIFQALGDEP